jgi:hypothetical protein
MSGVDGLKSYLIESMGKTEGGNSHFGIIAILAAPQRVHCGHPPMLGFFDFTQFALQNVPGLGAFCGDQVFHVFSVPYGAMTQQNSIVQAAWRDELHSAIGCYPELRS